ncbi:hypothetical protein GCM10009548_02320 [Streptomyces malaysiensis subsp. malaysiensis]
MGMALGVVTVVFLWLGSQITAGSGDNKAPVPRRNGGDVETPLVD